MISVLEARPNVGYYYVGLSPKDQTAEILRSYSVHDVLSQAVIVSPETNLYDTIVTIFTEDVGTIFGLRRFLFTRCCITQGFYCRASIGQTDAHTMPISMIMTPVSKVITVEPSDSLAVAAKK